MNESKNIPGSPLCSGCGENSIHAWCPTEEDTPAAAGDLAVCGFCGALNQYVDDGAGGFTFQSVKVEELGDEERSTVLQYQAAVLEMIEKERKEPS